jgi:hypothetical protein
MGCRGAAQVENGVGSGEARILPPDSEGSEASIAIPERST